MFLFAGVAVALGALFLLTRDSEKIPHIGGWPTTPLERGQLYRVWIRLTPEERRRIFVSPFRGMTAQASLALSVEHVLRSAGFLPLLVSSDPTDPLTWTGLVRWSHTSAERSLPSFVLRLQAVEEPPPKIQALLSPDARSPSFHLAPSAFPEPPPSLDRGLAWDEVDAILYALAKDEDPKHLGGFAAALDPDFPASASLLRLKEKLASLRTYPGSGRSLLRESEDKVAEDASRIAWEAFKASISDLGVSWDAYDAIVSRLAPPTPSASGQVSSLPGGQVSSLPGGQEDLRRVVSALAKDTRGLGLDLETLSRKLSVTRDVVRAAKSAVTVLPGGLGVVNAGVLRERDPEPFLSKPSPNAIQLAYAMRRPDLSLVRDKSALASRVSSVNHAAEKGVPEGIRAKDTISRANRLLEMRTWVDWYERVRAADDHEGPAGTPPGGLTRPFEGPFPVEIAVEEKVPE